MYMNRYYKSKSKLLGAIVLFTFACILGVFCMYFLYIYLTYKQIYEFEIILIPFEILLVSCALMLYQDAADLYKPYKRLLKKNIFILCNVWEAVPIEGKENYFYLEIDYTDENSNRYRFESEPLKTHEYNINPNDYIKVYVDIHKNPELYIVDNKSITRR